MAVETLSSCPSLARIFATSALTARLPKPSTLPERTLLLEGHRVAQDRLTAYQRVCGYGTSEVLPHTYPHVVGFPLQAQLMAARDFPLPLAGLVHLTNAITVHRTLTTADPLDLAVHAEDLRPHPKGGVVDLITEVRSGGDLVWEGRSTYLARGRGDDAAPVDPAPAVPDLPIVAQWRLPGSLGRSYAGVSGDVNPIHLHPLTAKAMGFPGPITHGMWSYARTLAALGRAALGPSRSRVWFTRPIFLPGTVGYVVDRSAGGALAAIVSLKDPAKDHLVLTLEA